MTHQDHISLIRKAVTSKGGRWADFGSGEGAFTLALQDLLGKKAEIYSVDKDESSLTNQKNKFMRLFPVSKIPFILADFSGQLFLPALDGIIMANSLHFFRNKVDILLHVFKYLKTGGTFILVEYNALQGNVWVPYPVSFISFQLICKTINLPAPEFLSAVPSYFLNEIYSARIIKSTK